MLKMDSEDDNQDDQTISLSLFEEMSLRQDIMQMKKEMLNEIRAMIDNLDIKKKKLKTDLKTSAEWIRDDVRRIFEKGLLSEKMDLLSNEFVALQREETVRMQIS